MAKRTTHLLLLGALALFFGCGQADDAAKGDDAATSGGGAIAPTPSTESAPPDDENALFLDRASEVGVDFVHWNGMVGDWDYSETMGSGVAIFDYDGDGDLDIFANQGRALGEIERSLLPPPPEGQAIDRLYRNEMRPGDPASLRFVDVTEESGLRADGYSMGVATGDIDNDGDVDLYITEWEGGNRLYRNRGDGTFEDITAEAGAADPRWSVAAAFFDADNDGLLDLYIGNYLDYSLNYSQECVNDIGLRDYCGPAAFAPQPDAFLHNRGDGRFEDATGAFGFLQPPAPVLGIVVGDWNLDGRPDIYIANDGYPNNLLIQQPDGSYLDEARLAGAAMNAAGLAEAGMGLTAGDVDNDGDEDLFLTHLDEETNTLYISEPGGLFVDRTALTGLGAPSFENTGFGTHFFDYDNDGLLDLFVANGAVQGIREQVAAGDVLPLRQPNQLYRNLGDARFEQVTRQAGSVFELVEVSRGAAFGDIDNDGDTDIVMTNNSGPLRLLLNQVGQDQSWIGFRVLDASGRHAIGARVDLLSPGGSQSRRIRTEGSYASANDPRALFGLARSEGTAEVRVTWPDGRQESWTELELGRYHDLQASKK